MGCFSRGMATANTTLPSGTSVPAAKLPVMTLLVCCLVTVVLAVSGSVGAVLFLARSGKLGGMASAAGEKKNAEAVTHLKALEPMLINLADEGGHAYLRLGVVLAEEDEPGAKPKEETKPVAGADASVRDTIFDVLGRQTSAGLLALDGKERLKAELMKAITERNADLHVRTVYFTDFLVQR